MDELEKQVWEKLIDKALEYLDEIIKPPLEEVGGMLADRVKLWRHKNQVDILLEAREYQERKGISPKTIPVKTLVNLIEASSYEEDDNLKKKWSALLANATDPSNNFDMHNVFIDILRQLSPLEAEVLDFMWEGGTFHNGQKYIASYSRYLVSDMRIYQNAKGLGNHVIENIDNSQEHVIVDNLMRLNLIKYETPKFTPQHGENSMKQPTEVLFTDLGFKMMEECTFKEVS